MGPGVADKALVAIMDNQGEYSPRPSKLKRLVSI